MSFIDKSQKLYVQFVLDPPPPPPHPLSPERQKLTEQIQREDWNDIYMVFHTLRVTRKDV